MAFIALFAFITVPIVEIAVFIEVGGRIGVWSTVGVVILTAVIGTAMLRQQGLSVLFRIQENLEANRIPVQELFDGVCLVIAGALLLTPGFVTDAFGFLLFVPPFRRWLAGEIGKRFLARADVRYSSQTYSSHPGYRGGPQTNAGPGPATGPVIDGEFQDITGDENGPAATGQRIENGDPGPSDDKPRR
ncbi:FxsA family protein [Thalassospiraceae bacterium LMO-JJ14]|nr:FxsA family protein [Thalassospiraceae bacterium LMO-JJ14]